MPCMSCSSQIISEMLPEIHTIEKCYFLKPISHSQIIQFSVQTGQGNQQIRQLKQNKTSEKPAFPAEDREAILKTVLKVKDY